MDINQPIVQSVCYQTQDISILLDILRLDLVHPHVSGNKWYKLKHNIAYVQEHGYKGILTFGGAYSNHLTATAAACKVCGIQSIGIVRGDELHKQSNESLQFCSEHDMQLEFVSRAAYDARYEESYWDYWREQYPGFYIVPEGGNNALGVQGTREILANIDKVYDVVACSLGTGTTFNGILDVIGGATKGIGFAPFKKGIYLKDHIHTSHTDWEVTDAYHFGGFGKHNEVLIAFMNDFYVQTGILLDKVYTAKMMYGITDMIQLGKIKQTKHILAIHTGGLQGNHTIKEQLVCLK